MTTYLVNSVLLGKGACYATGTNICQSGAIVCNAVPGTPGTEICDALDNDCDGAIDEGFNIGTSCSTGIGECLATGVYVCTENGDSTVCSAVPGLPGVELCDGLDNDCDGQVDEEFGLGSSCTVGVGQCANSGVLVCGPSGDAICSAQPGSPSGETCDSLDNDCDNQVDEGFGLGDSCTVGVGLCANSGVLICLPDGSSGCSVQPRAPEVETCDGLDNDCDSQIDEGFDLGGLCSVGVGQCANQGVYQCAQNGAAECSAQPGTPGTEICDGLDNDCDNQVDEGFNLGGICTVGTGQCTNQGVFQCGLNGAAECSAQPGTPGTETCDGLDNDCDNQIDEGFGLGDSCTVGLDNALRLGR